MLLNQKRILSHTLILVATLWFVNVLFVLFAQPLPLPQVPLPQVPLPQVPLPQTTPPLVPQHQPQPNAAPAAASGTTYTLARTSPDRLEQVLRQVCGHRFVVQGQHQYVFSSARENVPRQVMLRIEPSSNRMSLSGDRRLSDDVLRLISAIDQPPPQGRVRQIIPFQHVQPDVLMQALDAYRVKRPIVQQTQNVIQQVQFEGGFLDAGGIDSGMMLQAPGMQGFTQSGDPYAIGVAENVFNYQIIPSLDILVLEADGARLAQFVEMIRQIEELSKINRPKVEVVYLKHVNNVSLGAIITPQIYLDIFQTVQGTVRIIPMTSPNAILLLGWGDAMDVAKEFIASLDLPIAVENSRLHIFKLTHIPVTQAQQVLQSAFPVPPGQSGFMARIQFTNNPRANALIVQAAPNDLAEVERILKEIDVPGSAPRLQVKPIRLQHSLAPDLQQTLTAAISGSTPDGKFPALEMRIRSEEGQRLIQSGIMSDVTITTDVRNNVVIVRAPESSMEFIEELIAILDISSPEAAIKIFHLEHGNAQSLVTMLRSLFPSNADGLPGPQLPGAANEDTLIPIRFAVDDRTNTIIATGSTGDLMIVEALLHSLDREDSLAREQTVYFLKSMKAPDVATTINEFIRSRREIQQAAPGVIHPYAQIESEVIVVADVESNSLVISATPRYFDEIIELIKEIDRMPPQVVISVLIAEVTLTDEKEWAAELGLQDPIFFGRGGSMNFNNLSPLPDGKHYPESVASQMLSNFGAGRDGGSGGLVFSASSSFLNIMLRALQAENRLEVLSSPTITTMNNQQSVISVGQTVPRFRGTEWNQQQSRPIIEDVDVVTMLTIIPTISPEGTIVLSVALVKDKMGPQIPVGDIRVAAIDTSNLVTQVSAANNQTVVLGGLITREDTKDLRKVPFLGDIPLLGKFFRHEISNVTRKELLVILTPRIVESTEDMDRVRQIEMARMNWCLENVVETHGDIGAYSVVSPRPYTGNVPIITPGPVKMEDLQPLLVPTLPTPTLPRRN